MSEPSSEFSMWSRNGLNTLWLYTSAGYEVKITLTVPDSIKKTNTLVPRCWPYTRDETMD